MTDKALLTTKEAAKYLGYTEGTLKASRYTGKLSNGIPPKHTRMGNRTIRYKLTDLEQWVDEL